MNNAIRKMLALTGQGFVYSPQGRMLRRNLEGVWFQHSVTMPRYNVFMADDLQETIQFLRENRMDEVPFGVASVTEARSQDWNQTLIPEDCKTLWHRCARVLVVCESTSSRDLFQRLQRERKVWWRRLAQSPSRFKLTESSRGKTRAEDIVKVEAELPDGNVVVETISRQTQPRKLFPQQAEELHTIEHSCSLDWGCLAVLQDAEQTSTRACVQVNLAPYKVAFLTEENGDELDRFVLYLRNGIKARGLDAILTSSELVVEACLVPFRVLVQRSTLEDGVVRVACRATSLAEEVHVSNLAEYLASRCRL